MFRLYLGNLDSQVTEEDIQTVFTDRDLPAENILLKDGYAFVDCADQATVDGAIDQLAELRLYDKTLQVEPALAKQRNSNRLCVKNFPHEMTEEAIEDILNSYGTVKETNHSGDTVYVTYASPEQAQQAKDKLYDVEVEGQKLKVEFVAKKSRPVHNSYPKQEFPLRLLVPHQFVGAIIGKSGQTIRAITQQTNARVDVVRRDSVLTPDKMVMILAAQQQNCIDACQEILRVIQQEAANTASKEPELKILAHNNLCGRLIGKQGIIIKSIMEETDTQVTVSSVNSVSHMNQDRIVTIKGTVEAMVAAASKIYGKLRSCFEADMQSMRYSPGAMFYPGMPMNMQPWNMRNPFMPGMMPGQLTVSPAPPQPPSSGGHMTCYLFIPKASVGAVIGSKGSYINFVKSESRASCQVQERADEPEASDRPVKITGYPESVWKAQWYIFDKVKSEGFTGNEYARLRCDILVPRRMVGRIIGKGGQNVRQIQDISNAIIKLPDDQDNDEEEVPVQVIGDVYAHMLAQALIRQLITQGQIVNALPPLQIRGGPEMRGAPRHPHHMAHHHTISPPNHINHETFEEHNQ